MDILQNTNKTNRRERVRENLMHLAAEFVSKESNRQSLITITNANVSPNFSESTIFFTVIPESQEENVLNFLKRKRREFKQFVKQNTNMRKIPFFDFELDRGEKHRQKIEKISHKI